MSLKFPHVRLQVYDSLVNQRLGCGGSIVKCANELGLVNEEQSSTFKLPVETVRCGSIGAAEQVLRQCLLERGYCNGNGDQYIADQLWRDLQSAIESYERDNSAAVDQCAGQLESAVECSHIAPVVMDYLLQKLQPYL